MLLFSLPQGSTIVMDNISFHKKRILVAMASVAHCRLIFLPPYSPGSIRSKTSGLGLKIASVLLFIHSLPFNMLSLIVFRLNDCMLLTLYAQSPKSQINSYAAKVCRMCARVGGTYLDAIFILLGGWRFHRLHLLKLYQINGPNDASRINER